LTGLQTFRKILSNRGVEECEATNTARNGELSVEGMWKSTVKKIALQS
jgi:hypothetical protein